MKKTGLLLALLASANVVALETITPDHIKGIPCTLISKYVGMDLQELIGDAITKAHQNKETVEMKIPKEFGLKKYEDDLGALSLLYTVSNPYQLIVEISPNKILVASSKHIA